LAKELGLDDDLIAVNDTPERIYVLSNGQLAPLPDGLHLLVPTKLQSFLRSPLLSWWGKISLLADYFLPARQSESDESLADFVIRRMGHEALDKLADPLLAGVYNADMHEQSILATFPQYRQLEAKYGSLIKGMIAAEKNAPPSDLPALMSFQRGMSQLVESLVEKLDGNLRLDSSVENIKPDYSDYTIALTNSESISVDGLIMATPAHISAKLLESIAPESADGLKKIRYAGIGSMSLVFDKVDVPHRLDAYGVVIPSSAKRPIDGMQWASSKWAGRSPDDKAVIRVFFGGPHTRAMLEKSDDDLLAIVRDELRQILGITAEPVSYRNGLWHYAYPQYDVGHIEKIAGIESALPDSIRLAGNAYHGVGMPDTIKTAKAAAEAIAKSTVI
jgi:oxygen-dependent protoporphyrinogen oxidase